MIKLPQNKNLSGQLLLRNRGVPGFLICIKIFYGEVNCLRITFTDGCSCCGQIKYIVDIQSPKKEDLIKSVRKFYIFSYFKKEDINTPILWINTDLLKNISSDINNYHTNPQQVVFNYDVVKNLLINIETNKDTKISESTKIRIRELPSITFLFNHSINEFEGNFNNFYGDKKRILGFGIE